MKVNLIKPMNTVDHFPKHSVPCEGPDCQICKALDKLKELPYMTRLRQSRAGCHELYKTLGLEYVPETISSLSDAAIPWPQFLLDYCEVRRYTRGLIWFGRVNCNYFVHADGSVVIAHGFKGQNYWDSNFREGVRS